MFTTNYNKEKEYLRAQKRVEELKNFYKHLTVYIVMNTFISTMKVRRNLLNGETFEEAFFDFGTFAVWIFWGIAIAFIAVRLFAPNLFFSKNWEQEKIEELVLEDKKRKHSILNG